jgi:hypothetical protein
LALAALLDVPFLGWDRLLPPGRITLAGADGDHITRCPRHMLPALRCGCGGGSWHTTKMAQNDLPAVESGSAGKRSLLYSALDAETTEGESESV